MYVLVTFTVVYRVYIKSIVVLYLHNTDVLVLCSVPVLFSVCVCVCVCNTGVLWCVST